MGEVSLRAIPSVDKVLRELGETDVPRAAVVALVRRELAAMRKEGGGASDGAVTRIRSALDTLRRARIQPVINGTGIVVHTNLGRSPLGPRVVEALTRIASDYNNLEYDLTGGERGGRAAYLEHNLAVLAGGEAATVVNNCAAALVLVLRHFARGERREVVISRGELVQIGGGFRIPEILEASGAALREIGTTNKTSASDYNRAVGKNTALVLKVHRSNFFMGGFVESPPTEEIAAVAKAKKVPFVEDLGTGAVFRTESLGGGEHEPTAGEVLKKGVDLVVFSGDKLLGGPQAGVIAGRGKLVASIKKDPFFRALRCDKLILSALQETVDLHLNEAGGIPILEMMRLTEGELRARGEKLVAALAGLPLTASVGKGDGQIGGGTLPKTRIPSVTLDVVPQGIALADFAARLRAGSPPVIGYVSGARFKLDLRTIFPRQDEPVVRAINLAVGFGGK
ncbi:MAG TPA: L-seryl-tRNA(Sec) selenium transferase [Tepidisphaeraceae bacterium]|nr:L-seryl-tRNA(Sec) selenium transferase [Tepidisphaeraceae bacterium]